MNYLRTFLLPPLGDGVVGSRAMFYTLAVANEQRSVTMNSVKSWAVVLSLATAFLAGEVLAAKMGGAGTPQGSQGNQPAAATMQQDRDRDQDKEMEQDKDRDQDRDRERDRDDDGAMQEMKQQEKQKEKQKGDEESGSPQGMEKQREMKMEQERKEEGKGSEEGQSQREERSHKWWRFWE
jgi:hypothetical protein